MAPPRDDARGRGDARAVPYDPRGRLWAEAVDVLTSVDVTRSGRWRGALADDDDACRAADDLSPQTRLRRGGAVDDVVPAAVARPSSDEVEGCASTTTARAGGGARRLRMEAALQAMVDLVREGRRQGCL